MGHDAIISAGVAVSRGDVSLWGRTVAVSTPWRDKCCEVTICLVEGHRVVTIPGIEYGLLLVEGYQSGLVEWRLCVVCLPCGVPVEGLEINGASEGAILLCHPVAPRDGGPNGYLLQHAQSDVPVQPRFHLLLPV